MVWIILGAIALAAVYGGIRIRNKIREFSRIAFDTDNLMEGLKKANTDSFVTPKSVSAMTSLLLPQILHDFPEFDYDEWRVKSQNILKAYVQSLSTKNEAMIKESALNANSDLIQAVHSKINALNMENKEEAFDEFRIHRTEISAYNKRDGRCVITFQSSVQSKHYVTDVNSGEIIAGSKENLFQSRYEVDLVYIQDRSVTEGTDRTSIGLTCPNCGAAVRTLGQKVCEYCGTGIIEFSIQTWYFGEIRER